MVLSTHVAFRARESTHFMYWVTGSVPSPVVPLAVQKVQTFL